MSNDDAPEAAGPVDKAERRTDRQLGFLTFSNQQNADELKSEPTVLTLTYWTLR
jgi:hypothetical protein